MSDMQSMERCNGRSWYEEKWYIKVFSGRNMNFLDQIKI